MGLLSGLMGNAGAVEPEKLQEKYGSLLIDGEGIEAGFQLIRDVFIFTTKRLILVDRQGMTGKKVEYLSVAYKNISRYSIETAGHLDLDAELKIWISSEREPSIQKKFNRKVNIYSVQQLLSKHVLG
uniref:PH domain-containing protein n=1 Tax=Roseihalotalea indica TaxID=2867963 RepID=A0AA49GQZ0_9BACT|nr:PH domain-containing protein [Tunicatimonas sp. TK19036]